MTRALLVAVLGLYVLAVIYGTPVYVMRHRERLLLHVRAVPLNLSAFHRPSFDGLFQRHRRFSPTGKLCAESDLACGWDR